VKRDRGTRAQIEEHLGRLMEAVHQAQEAGAPLACSLKTIPRRDRLSDLAASFEARRQARQ